MEGGEIDQLKQVAHPIDLLGTRKRGGRGIESNDVGRQPPGIGDPAGGEIAGDDKAGEGRTGRGERQCLLDQRFEGFTAGPPLPAVEPASEGLAITGEDGDESSAPLGTAPASLQPLPLGIGLDPGLDEAIEER